jgi:diguanylate cyclase (GGDEF)-like protein
MKTAILPSLAKTWRRGYGRVVAFARRRSLIGEILALQVLFATVIGLLALTSLWWASSWIIRDYNNSLSEQWLANLDRLGMPLYVSEDEEKYTRIENYVSNFPEISFVRYYDRDGEPIFFEASGWDQFDIAPFSPVELEELASDENTEGRHSVETTAGDIQLLRISKPIWTESLLMDGLLGFEFGNQNAIEASLVGFVEIGLDFSAYQSQLSRNILIGAVIGVIVILMLTSASWFVYRRALLPLSHLQKPLRELAKGKTSQNVQTSGHKEIVAIADALNTTVTALNERDQRLWQLANHDQLTGLVNRHRFSELLDQELDAVKRSGKTSALLFIDLDQFKCVNDTFGHAAGDRLLKHVAEQLRANVRKQDVVSRFGGDEFIALIRDVDTREIKAICEALLRLRDHRFEDNEDPFSIRCSIGVTMLHGDDLGPTELLAQADMACHQAKARGRHRFQMYKTSSRELSEMAADVGWSQQIQKALKDDKFVLHYQPIIDVATGKPAFFEVLLRMQTGPRKFIPPSAFLPAANRFGLMAEIDQWVIRNAVKKLAGFRSRQGDIQFTLNVSGCIFETADSFKYVQSQLEANDVPLDAIVLEITEQVAVQNMGNAAKQIAYFAERGCRFAIDDFGAGHSSYKYLKNLPVDFIKIDGSFIKNLVDDYIDQRIVNSICEIAEATNCKTVAEHVGDYQTLELLRELGVNYGQGFFLGRPSARLKSEPIPISMARRQKRRRQAG